MAIVKTNDQHYMDIANAIRSKNGTAQQYQPQEMSGAILDLESGSQNSAIIVYAPAGSQVTVSCGDVVKTAAEHEGVWRFENCDLGTWTVAAAKDGFEKEYTVVIQEKNQQMRYEVYVVYLGLFGVMRDITSSSPLWTRTEISENFSVTVPTETTPGYSDFDQYYPWRDIQRQTLSTGDVMVRIPKFWYRRYREGNIEHLKIADAETDGFKLHPAFNHAGVEQDAVYVGAYKLSDGGKSLPSVDALVNKTRSQMRTLARNKGTGWGLMDIATLSAIQMLYLVEFATYHSQEAIGRGLCDGGSSSARTPTGTTEDFYNNVGHTGRPGTAEDGKIDTLWRGVEGLWGNVLEFLDGLNVDCTNSLYYVCNDPTLYADGNKSNYKSLGFALPSITGAGNYIVKLGLDAANDHVMVPSDVTNGSGSTYVCDFYTKNGSSITAVAKYGGHYSHGDKCGLFHLDGSGSSATGSTNTGARLVYIPQEVSE